MAYIGTNPGGGILTPSASYATPAAGAASATATGGLIVNANGYRYHYFFATTGDFTFLVTSPGDFDLLLVGGGGGGSFGGGGGGACLTGTQYLLAGSYAITIGAGGNGRGLSGDSSRGGSTTFAGNGISHTAQGGGAGGGTNDGASYPSGNKNIGAGGNAGTGGGAGHFLSGGQSTNGGLAQQAASSPLIANAFDGGGTNGSCCPGGGGGGAGNIGSFAEGTGGSTDPGGLGGPGIVWYDGCFYGAGGGGSYGNCPGGRSGGKAVGDSSGSGPSSSGFHNSGAGGGGGNSSGKAGQAGAVVIRYKVNQTPANYATSNLFLDFDPADIAIANGAAISSVPLRVGSGVTGNINGTITYRTVKGGALELSSDAYLTFTASGSNFNPLNTASSISVSAWVYSTGVARCGLVSRFAGGGTDQFNHMLDPDGDFHWNSSGAGNGAGTSSEKFLWHPRQWNHVVWVYNSDDAAHRWYCNGQLVKISAGGSSQATPSGNTATIGYGARSDGYEALAASGRDGWLGPMRIYTRALTFQEISQEHKQLRGRFGI